MDSDPPLVQDVPSKADVSPNVDHSITSPKQMQQLRKDMWAVFDEHDAKEAAAKESQRKLESPAPAEQKIEEPLVGRPEKKEATPNVPVADAPQPSAEPEVKADQKVELKLRPEPKPEVQPPVIDKELDDIQIHDGATDVQKGNFKKLKDIAGDYRKQLESAKEQINLYRDVVGPLAKEFGHDIGEDPNSLVTTLSQAAADIRKAKSASLTPEVQGELEYLRGLQRSVDVLNSREFVSKHVEPWIKSYHKVIDDICKYCDGTPEQIEDYRKKLKEEIKPRDISPKYWEDEIEKVAARGKASKYDIMRIHNEVTDMLKLQQTHDDTATELVSKQDGYEKWMADRKKEADVAWVVGVEQAVKESINRDNGAKKHMAALFPLPDSKDPEEQKKVVAHNARFDDMSTRFRKFIEDFQSGPKGAAERALDYVDLQNGNIALKSELDSTTSQFEEHKKKSTEDIEALSAKVKQLESEVSSRRRISDTPLKPTAGAVKQTPGKPALPKGPRGGLEEAFKNFQWPTT